jgi:hypothetical protein
MTRKRIRLRPATVGAAGAEHHTAQRSLEPRRPGRPTMSTPELRDGILGLVAAVYAEPAMLSHGQLQRRSVWL